TRLEIVARFKHGVQRHMAAVAPSPNPDAIRIDVRKRLEITHAVALIGKLLRAHAEMQRRFKGLTDGLGPADRLAFADPCGEPGPEVSDCGCPFSAAAFPLSLLPPPNGICPFASRGSSCDTPTTMSTTTTLAATSSPGSSAPPPLRPMRKRRRRP